VLSRGVLEGATPRLIVAAGKAAWPMAAAVANARMHAHGIVAGTPIGALVLPSSFERFEAGHPVPNAASVAAALRALDCAAGLNDGDVMLVLLSGGASAMLAAPAEGLTLVDKVETTSALLRAGVAIDGMNAVRKHLSRIKGGRLAAGAARTITLALSDVHGPAEDDPSVIGSGPTAADNSTYADALRVIGGSGARVPERVRNYLERGARGEITETLKPGDRRLASATYEIIGNRHTVLEAASRSAQAHGYVSHVLPSATTGEARESAQRFFTEVRRIAADGPRPLCVLAAGETTVTVTGRGKGGRNQEFALALVPMAGDFGPATALASVGTDGVDGPTEAAGAIVDSSTSERAARAGVDWKPSLSANDSYHFFEPLGDLVRWGPTGTNVGDLQVVLIG
jgi:hydroxypyruvate reductase